MSDLKLPLPDIASLPDALGQVVADELQDDEKLLWLGQPDRLRGALGVFGFNLIIMLIGIGMEIGLYIFWQHARTSRVWLQSESSSFSRVMLLVPLVFFAIIGMYMMLYPLLGWLKAMQQACLVTDHRVLYVEQRKRKLSIEQMTFDQLEKLQVDQGENQSKGDLIIIGMINGRRRRQREIDFLHIHQPHAVANLIREQMASCA